MRRCKILAFWKAGYKQADIAKEIGLRQSTISRELSRHIIFVRTQLGSWQYKPDYAQAFADQKHREKKKKVKLTNEAKSFIREKLQQKWNPDQISGYAKKHQLFSIGKEWIYQFILRDKKKGGKLYLNLRHQLIDERPKIIEERSCAQNFILRIHIHLGSVD
ncbi:MAG: hypothetical protein ABI597_04325 [Gammaproteobacteria bacterium]